MITRPRTKVIVMSMWSPSTLYPWAIIVKFATKVVHLGMPFVFTTFDITVIKIEVSAKFVFLDVNSEILKRMDKDTTGWKCNVCGFSTTTKARTWEHIESKHMNLGGYTCGVCLKFCPTASSLRNHNDRYHKLK